MPDMDPLSAFKQMLVARPIGPEAVDAAAGALAALPVAEHERALNWFEQQLAGFGSEAARSRVRQTPILRLGELLAALPPAEVPDWLQQRLVQAPLLSSQNLSALPPGQRQELLGLAARARDYYRGKASRMRSASNPATASSARLSDFLAASHQSHE